MDHYKELVNIIKKLRDKENGCPWDLKQTNKSLLPNFVEELYEAVEAIEEEDWDSVAIELGDLLLHIVMQSVIAEENGLFTTDDVVKLICEKLIRRHPHIFGNAKVNNVAEIKQNWEKIKKEEHKDSQRSVLAGIPDAMPSLIIAERIQDKAASVGFDWPSVEPVWDKLYEEIEELKNVVPGNVEHLEEELGDVLFSTVNLARKLGIDAETALRKSVKKFRKRFEYIERLYNEKGMNIYNSTLEQLDAAWELAKKAKD